MHIYFTGCCQLQQMDAMGNVKETIKKQLHRKYKPSKLKVLEHLRWRRLAGNNVGSKTSGQVLSPYPMRCSPKGKEILWHDMAPSSTALFVHYFVKPHLIWLSDKENRRSHLFVRNTNKKIYSLFTVKNPLMTPNVIYN